MQTVREGNSILQLTEKDVFENDINKYLQIKPYFKMTGACSAGAAHGAALRRTDRFASFLCVYHSGDQVLFL